jgi:mRNA interferase RelE/StbE
VTDYAIIFARSARKELEKLKDPLLSRVLERIEKLVNQPRPAGCRKLQGAEDLWRIRVGEHRVLYSVDDDRTIVDIIAIRHRSDAYK